MSSETPSPTENAVADRRVYKYELEITDEQYIPVSTRSKILSVQMQHGRLVLWALVDVNTVTTGARRRIYVVGTGNRINGDLMGMCHVGTVQQFDGQLVWHVFAETHPSQP